MLRTDHVGSRTAKDYVCLTPTHYSFPACHNFSPTNQIQCVFCIIQYVIKFAASQFQFCNAVWT